MARRTPHRDRKVHGKRARRTLEGSEIRAEGNEASEGAQEGRCVGREPETLRPPMQRCDRIPTLRLSPGEIWVRRPGLHASVLHSPRAVSFCRLRERLVWLAHPQKVPVEKLRRLSAFRGIAEEPCLPLQICEPFRSTNFKLQVFGFPSLSESTVVDPEDLELSICLD